MSNKIVALNVGAIKVKRFSAYGSGDTIKFDSNLNLQGNLNITNNLAVLSEEESTGVNNGAMVVSGGLGIQKNVNVNGNLNVSNGALMVKSNHSIDSIRIGIGTENPRTSLDIIGSDAIIIPKGTDAEWNQYVLYLVIKWSIYGSLFST